MTKELKIQELKARKRMLGYRNRANGNIIKKIDRKISKLKMC